MWQLQFYFITETKVRTLENELFFFFNIIADQTENEFNRLLSTYLLSILWWYHLDSFQHEIQHWSVFGPAEIKWGWNLPFLSLPWANTILLLSWLKTPCPGLCKVYLVSPHLVFLLLLSTLSPFQGVYEGPPCGEKALAVFALGIVSWQGAKGACQSTGPKVFG